MYNEKMNEVIKYIEEHLDCEIEIKDTNNKIIDIVTKYQYNSAAFL